MDLVRQQHLIHVRSVDFVDATGINRYRIRRDIRVERFHVPFGNRFIDGAFQVNDLFLDGSMRRGRRLGPECGGHDEDENE